MEEKKIGEGEGDEEIMKNRGKKSKKSKETGKGKETDYAFNFSIGK